MVVPGSASGNFQSRACAVSLHGCSTSGGSSQMEEEEEPQQKIIQIFPVLHYVFISAACLSSEILYLLLVIPFCL
jgi:hypothetical protein